MAFNLDKLDLDNVRIGYFPYTTGLDRLGKECMMVVNYDRSSSGCNPFYWDASNHNQFGHEFATQEEAENQAKYARVSWSVSSRDPDNIKIGVVRFTVLMTAVNMGNVG